MESRDILEAIKSKIVENGSVWHFCHDKGTPMGNVTIGNIEIPVRSLALDIEDQPCFLVDLQMASTEELNNILNCM
ncbi:hypothetical protein POZ03_01380 [Bacteroides uniformis]|uniref:hypothetical protein n=1 Tax=Bacteroides uniformis TaxID=820 RepID=UPI00233EB1B7|nr:hypothetical protein [Bacteroides uniformis]MDC1809108.1 hypothetical protein [Bacteroides uniformis]